MDAAVVELDALPDAVRSRAEDHHALARLGRDFAFDGVVGLVMVGRRAFELGGAGVDRLERGADAEQLAARAYRQLVGSREVGDLSVGDAVALRDEERVTIELLELQAGQRTLDRDHIGDARDEERVDARDVRHALDAQAATQRLGGEEDALGSRTANEILEGAVRVDVDGAPSSPKPPRPFSSERIALPSASSNVRPMAMISPTAFMRVDSVSSVP